MPKPLSQLQITKVSTQHVATTEDMLVVEEPLEIKLAYGAADSRQQKSLAITMRTPGQDEELVLGFLLTEGLIGRSDQVLAMQHIGQALHPDAKENVLLVELHPEVPIDFETLSRHFYTSSSCGVCGKASIEMVRTSTCYFPRTAHPVINADILHGLPTQLRQKQSLFDCTGGIHAAALFDATGQLLLMREDVGRHNAMDKLVGAAMQQGIFPLREHIILVSGRASFELVQKALMAGAPFMAAVGAPSSLAVELADDYGMSLVGFLRGGRFNVYCGVERVVLDR
jgi:FdhD protein